MPIDTVELKFNCDKNSGLSIEEAQRRLLNNGPNSIVQNKREHFLLKLLKIFFSGFSLLLVIGSIASFIGYGVQTEEPGNLYVAVALAAVVLISGIFTFYNENKSENIMNSFSKLIPKKAKVLRSGQWELIQSENLVVGDVVAIEKGDSVPADIRIIKSSGGKVSLLLT